MSTSVPCYCAPGVDSPTCLSADDYVQLAEAYNRWMRRLSPHTEGESWTPIPTDGDAWDIVAHLDRIVELQCHDLRCLTETEFFSELLGERAAYIQSKFRPQGPTTPTGWLSNHDIDRIMVGYQNVYPHFRWLGAVPADCSHHQYCQLAAVRWDRLWAEGIREAGVIFNRDRIGEPGSHWVALYLRLGEGTPAVCFCDSVGRPPSPEMSSFIDTFRDWCQSRGQTPVTKTNQIRYQTDKTECGVYSCNFIIRMLAGHRFEEVVGDRPDFDLIQGCRRYYFGQDGRPHSSCDPDRLG